MNSLISELYLELSSTICTFKEKHSLEDNLAEIIIKTLERGTKEMKLQIASINSMKAFKHEISKFELAELEWTSDVIA